MPQSAHLIRGFSQTPARHSFAQAGAYPDFPVVLLSQRVGYASKRPRNSRRNSATFSVVERRDGSGSGSEVAGTDGERHSMRCCSRRDISRAFSALSSSTNGWDRSWCIESEKCQFVVGRAKTILPSDAQLGRQRTIAEAILFQVARSMTASIASMTRHVPSRPPGDCLRSPAHVVLEKVNALRDCGRLRQICSGLPLRGARGTER